MMRLEEVLKYKSMKYSKNKALTILTMGMLRFRAPRTAKQASERPTFCLS